MGGLSWFAIPWLAATTMGLSALALETNPVFPTYPQRMADADVTAGLVLPEAAVALMGKGGAAAVLLLVFMAVTSASSAEYIAVSSICTYDIYQTYFNPRASGKTLIYISHMSVVVYAILLAAFSTGLYCEFWDHCRQDSCANLASRYWHLYGLYVVSQPYEEDKLNHSADLYLLMGVIISSAVLPATLSLMWSKQNTVAATLTPFLGLICSLTAWLVTAKKQTGNLSVASTGSK
jgi:Na+/proline symporter